MLFDTVIPVLKRMLDACFSPVENAKTCGKCVKLLKKNSYAISVSVYTHKYTHTHNYRVILHS